MCPIDMHMVIVDFNIKTHMFGGIRIPIHTVFICITGSIMLNILFIYVYIEQNNMPGVQFMDNDLSHCA